MAGKRSYSYSRKSLPIGHEIYLAFRSKIWLGWAWLVFRTCPMAKNRSRAELPRRRKQPSLEAKRCSDHGRQSVAFIGFARPSGRALRRKPEDLVHMGQQIQQPGIDGLIEQHRSRRPVKIKPKKATNSVNQSSILIVPTRLNGPRKVSLIFDRSA